MVIIDYIFLASLALGLFLGLWKGFLKQVFAIVGVFVIGLLTSVVSPYPDKWLHNAIKSDGTRHLVAVLITFVVLTIIYAIVTKLISKAVNKIPILGWLNRLLGAIFSVVVVYMVYAVLIAIVLRANSGLMVKLQGHFAKSWIVNHIYGGTAHTGRNFFGNWLVDLFVKKISALLPKK